MKPLSECLLYAFVDTAYLHGRDPAEVARQLCDGGADLIQLRAKAEGAEEARRMAEAILPVTARAGAGLVMNDHWQTAWEMGIPLTHLGQEDFFDAGYAHRGQLFAASPSLSGKTPPLLGLSTHAPEQAARALEAGADYIAIGPVFPTGTKPTAKAVTLGYVRWAAAQVAIPWFAIGGIHLQNLDDVLAAGARRVCVVSAILNAPDIRKACQSFKDRLRSAPKLNP